MGCSYIALAIASLGPAAALAAGPADQQSVAAAPAPGVQRPNELTEVVVTAERRNESAQRTPVSVTAISQVELQKKAIVSEADLQSSAPGLTVRSTSNNNQLNFAIRGQSVDSFSSSASAVLQYFDEVQISPVSASPFYDLQSIQVLKGPQGTLFGRNATGGAVLFTSHAPDEAFGGYIMGRVGDYAAKSFEGAINIPIVSDRLLLRVAGTYQYHDGYTFNLYANKRVGTVDRGGVRASLFARLSDSVTNNLVVDYNQAGGTDQPNVAYSAYAPGSTHNGNVLDSTGALLFSPGLDAVTGAGSWAAYLAAHPKAYAGGLVAYVALQRARGPYLVNEDSDFAHRSHAVTVSNVTKYEVGPNFSIKNIFGYSTSYAFDNQEYDGTPYQIEGEGQPGVQPSGQINSTRSITDELQIQGKAIGARLQYTAGLYYSNDFTHQPGNVYFFDLSPIIPVTYEFLGANDTNTTYAVYGQGTYDLSDLLKVSGLKFTGGIRYTQASAAQDLLPGSTGYDNPALSHHLSTSVGKISWQVGVQEQVNPDVMLYVVSRHSFRSGGFNMDSPSRPGTAAEGGAQFKPEETTDVEVGAKYQGHIGDVPVRLNVDFYQQWVRDVQRTIYATVPDFGLSALTVNVPEAVIQGVEVDGELRPTSWLELGGNVAYTNGRYTKNEVGVFGQNEFYGPFSDTPTWSGNAFVQVTIPTPERVGLLSARADIYAQSKFYFSSLANTIAPDTAIKGYVIANFRVALDNIGGSNFSLAASVRNAFNQVYYTGGLATGTITSINTASPGSPRTFFVEGRYKF